MTAPGGRLSFVMAGLVPAIHVFLAACFEEVDARNKPGHDEYRAQAGCASASISTTILPVVTCSPSATSMAEIVPDIGAACTCSIFMASKVITGWPAQTRSPDLTRTATTRPFIAARTLPSLPVAV